MIITEKNMFFNELNTNDGYAIGCLLRLYSYQTAEEQVAEGTIFQNNMGFNGVDGNFLSNVAKFYLDRGYLTKKQIDFFRKKLHKYSKQLLGADIPILPIGERKVKKVEEVKDLVTLNGTPETLKITFLFSRERLGQVKSLSGRRWNPDGKYWTCPVDYDNLKDLIEFKFELDAPVKKMWDDMNKTRSVDYSRHPALDGLFPFQKEGVAFVDSRNGRALIGDEMGLGKTWQAAGYLKIHPELRPAVIVCPASLKLNWRNELKKLIPNEPVHVIQGNKNSGNFNFREDIIIINYDVLNSWVGMLSSMDLGCVILDEVHYTKNSKAQRTKAVKQLAKSAKSIIGLTGTPIINRPVEFFNILNMLDPIKWSSFWKYAQKYCDAKNNGFGWDFSGASNTEELHEKSKSVMIRRLKSEVLPDLPSKIRTVVPMEISNMKEYQSAAKDLIGWIREKEGDAKASQASQAEQLVRFEKLKQLVVDGKMKNAIDWIRNALDSNGKLVVFATHRNVILNLEDSLKEYNPVVVDGSVPTNKRQGLVEKFQNDNTCKLFIGNIKAAGVGLTLTAASATCFVELGWTPGEHDQAEDRVHRIGQKADSVQAYYLLADETIETEIAELLDQKRKVLDAVLDGKVVEETALLKELINRLKGE